MTANEMLLAATAVTEYGPFTCGEDLSFVGLGTVRLFPLQTMADGSGRMIGADPARPDMMMGHATRGAALNGVGSYIPYRDVSTTLLSPLSLVPVWGRRCTIVGGEAVVQAAGATGPFLLASWENVMVDGAARIRAYLITAPIAAGGATYSPIVAVNADTNFRTPFDIGNTFNGRFRDLTVVTPAPVLAAAAGRMCQIIAAATGAPDGLYLFQGSRNNPTQGYVSYVTPLPAYLPVELFAINFTGALIPGDTPVTTSVTYIVV